MKIIVAGAFAAAPEQGGKAWAVLQYLIGFQRLGHDVHFIEPFFKKARQPPQAPLHATRNAQAFRRVLGGYDLLRGSCLLERETLQTVGLPYTQVKKLAREADLIVNLCGILRLPELLEPVPVRLFLDLEPGFTQLWHASGQNTVGLGAHNRFLTTGLNIGRPDCPVPACGRGWGTTLQPVVLELCPPADPGDIHWDAWTTVANWRGYGGIEYEGERYGPKADSWRRLIDLPKDSREKFAPALNIHPDEEEDIAALENSGWNLLDPEELCSTPETYQRFVCRSRGEIAIAKCAYVKSQVGRLSDRSVCYLASGRPVIAQDTGLADHLPPDSGLQTFRSAEDALEAVDGVNRAYPGSCEAARRLAREFFSHDKVLPRLLAEC